MKLNARVVAWTHARPMQHERSFGTCPKNCDKNTQVRIWLFHVVSLFCPTCPNSQIRKDSCSTHWHNHTMFAITLLGLSTTDHSPLPHISYPIHLDGPNWALKLVNPTVEANVSTSSACVLPVYTLNWTPIVPRLQAIQKSRSKQYQDKDPVYFVSNWS